MTNLEIFNKAFMDVFLVKEVALNENFSKNTIEEWDSVHQLNIIALLEESFDIMLEPEDIVALVSYQSGKEIIAKYGIEL